MVSSNTNTEIEFPLYHRTPCIPLANYVLPISVLKYCYTTFSGSPLLRGVRGVLNF
jgi:hypothetical protein